MNNAEHIRCQVRCLAEKDQITRMQLVEIIEEILLPFIEPTTGPEPKLFERVNETG
jgi:hypothetical protein